MTVALESGKVVVVVQEHREPSFRPDDPVTVYTTRMGESLIYHAGENPGRDPDTNAYLIREGEDVPEYDPITF